MKSPQGAPVLSGGVGIKSPPAQGEPFLSYFGVETAWSTVFTPQTSWEPCIRVLLMPWGLPLTP